MNCSLALTVGNIVNFILIISVIMYQSHYVKPRLKFKYKVFLHFSRHHIIIFRLKNNDKLVITKFGTNPAPAPFHYPTVLSPHAKLTTHIHPTAQVALPSVVDFPSDMPLRVYLDSLASYSSADHVRLGRHLIMLLAPTACVIAIFSQGQLERSTVVKGEPCRVQANTKSDLAGLRQRRR